MTPRQPRFISDMPERIERCFLAGSVTIKGTARELDVCPTTVRYWWRKLKLPQAAVLSSTKGDRRPLRSRVEELRALDTSWTHISRLTQCGKPLLYRLSQQWGLAWDEAVPLHGQADAQPERLAYRCPRCAGIALRQEGHAPGVCRRRFHPHILGVLP